MPFMHWVARGTGTPKAIEATMQLLTVLKPKANRFFFLIAKMQSSPANCCVDPGIMGQIVAQVPCTLVLNKSMILESLLLAKDLYERSYSLSFVLTLSLTCICAGWLASVRDTLLTQTSILRAHACLSSES